MIRPLRAVPALLCVGAWVAFLAPGRIDAQTVYRAYVAAESEDEVAVLRFDTERGLEVERVISVGRWPAEIEGPHGVFFDPTGAYWYLTLGHGFPNGTLLQFDASADTVVAWSELGMFPATISLTHEGALAFVVNSNFYGDMVPSTLSIIDTKTMFEIAQVETCTMPHGSRMSVDGTHHYSACMMDNQLVEVSTQSLEVTRRMDLVTGTDLTAHDAGAHGAMRSGTAPICSPTWTLPAPDGATLYVACNKGDQIVEVDLESWSVARRFDAEGAPYNLALTPDGSRLLATLKGSAQVGVWDVESGERVATVESSQRVTHGVATTDDGRFAFVTVEGVGGEPGLVEVIDLSSLERVASAEIGKQAGGIALVP